MENSSSETLDLSRRGLKKIEKAPPEESKTIINLILDQNELHRLDNIDTYTRVENLSICNNFLQRMHGVTRLSNVRVLSLNNNGIIQIEGLKDMTYLKVLKLAGNSIKSIEHLNHNTQLEHLDLSNNQIAFIADISYLKNLKHLNLERNKIMDLRQCDRYLPTNLGYLGLAHNNIQDLNEVCHLVHLGKLESFTMQGNPCVSMSGKDKLGYDYRPFIVNWIMSVKSIDGFIVSAIESLKAEWLYSQGKGRHFHSGQHQELTEYLATTCPLTTEALNTEDHKKLSLILSKAQHHQQQLKDQTHSPIKPRLQSPRMQSRISSRHVGRSPDRMSSSYHSALGLSPQLSQSMVRSCDASSLGLNSSHDSATSSDRKNHPSLRYVDTGVSESSIPQPKPVPLPQPKPNHQSLEAASKMVPVPESLMSPDYQDPMYDIHKTIRAQNNSTHSVSNTSSNNSSIHEDRPHRQIQQPSAIHKNLKGSPKLTKSAASSPKLKSKMENRKGSLTNLKQDEKKLNGVAKEEKDSDTESDKVAVKFASNQRRQKNMNEESMAAVTIQKIWRGYRSRNLNKDTLRILHAIQAARARQHIQRLTCDMEATKAALESERKIQQLQMQAINALWKKVSTLQATDHKQKCTEPESADVLKQLSETCINLQSQVAELQSCMKQVVSQVSNKTVVATQTDVIAVDTPQEERLSWLKRPQSLQLNVPIVPTSKTEEITQTEEIIADTIDCESIEIDCTESIIIEDKSVEDSISFKTGDVETREKIVLVD